MAHHLAYISLFYQPNDPWVSTFYRWGLSGPHWVTDSPTVSRSTLSCSRISQSLNDCQIPKPVTFYCSLWNYSSSAQTWEPGSRNREHWTQGVICLVPGKGHTNTSCSKLCRFQRHSQILFIFKMTIHIPFLLGKIYLKTHLCGNKIFKQEYKQVSSHPS